MAESASLSIASSTTSSSSWVPLSATAETRAFIFDLPNEILLEIADTLEEEGRDEELLQLAMVCRRFHSVFLPVLFSLYGFTGTSQRPDLAPGLIPLPLSISLDAMKESSLADVRKPRGREQRSSLLHSFHSVILNSGPSVLKIHTVSVWAKRLRMSASMSAPTLVLAALHIANDIPPSFSCINIKLRYQAPFVMLERCLERWIGFLSKPRLQNVEEINIEFEPLSPAEQYHDPFSEEGLSEFGPNVSIEAGKEKQRKERRVREDSWMVKVVELISVASRFPGVTVNLKNAWSWKAHGKPFQHTIVTEKVESSSEKCIKRKCASIWTKWLQFFGPIRKRTSKAKSKSYSQPPSVSKMNACLPSGPGSSSPRFKTIITLQTTPRENCFPIPLPWSSQLHCLNITSPILFQTPFYSATIRLLNSSPLRSLSLDGLGLSHYDWTLILPSITIPTLTSLSLGNSQIAFPDLSAFLKRHPSIKRLDLAKGVAIGPLKENASRHLLPDCEELIANPEYLVHFLRPVEALPKLKAVTITSEYRIKTTFYDYCQFDDVLACMAARARRSTESAARSSLECVRFDLELRLLSSPGLEEWLSGTCADEATEAMLKDIYLEKLVVDLGDLDQVSPALLEKFDEWSKLFGLVKELLVCGAERRTE